MPCGDPPKRIPVEALDLPTDRASGLPMNVETYHLLTRAEARLERLGRWDFSETVSEISDQLLADMTEDQKRMALGPDYKEADDG